MGLLTTHNEFDVPPGGWRYFVPQTGSWSESFTSKPDMLDHAGKFFRRNGWQAPTEAEIIDQMCRRLIAEGIQGACIGDNVVSRSGKLRTSWEIFKQGTTTLGDWILSGGKVDHNEACRRAAICVHCPLNDDPKGCMGCGMGNKIRDLVSGVSKSVGGLQPTPHDAQLKACVVCSCALKAKVHVPLDIIRRNMPEGQEKLLWEKCWILPKP